MLARHPLTGKDIRVISLDTSFWRDQKTLAWFDEPPKGARWSRWDIGTTSVTNARALTAAGFPPDVVLCLGPYEETLQWCIEGLWSAPRILGVPKAFVDHIGLEKLLALRMGNVICLDEIHDMYPFVGEKWDGTEKDAKVLMAMVLHCGRTFPLEPSARNTRGLRVESEAVKPQPMWYITQYYIPEKRRRRLEIETCLTKNLACPVIDKIILLNETACAPKHAKIEEHVIGKRLSYASVLRWIYDRVPRDVLVTFANADIFLDAESWRLLWSTDIELTPKFLALLRWDVETGDAEDAKIFGPRADSQDTWVVSSNAVKAVEWDWAALDIPFGKGGCDNAITVEMFKKRFLIGNPALTLKTYHLHASGDRSYNPRDIVNRPAYLHIHPTGLHDMKPVMNYDAYPSKMITFTPFERRIRGPLSRAQAKTFCAMVGRASQGLVELDVDSANVWSPPPLALSRMTDVFQTRDGLVYDYNSILVGSTKASAKAWSNSHISSLSASITVEDAMIAPLSDSVASSPGRYVLEYMSKVFLLRNTFDSRAGEFWCSKDPNCTHAIKMFSWPKQEIPVLSRDENQQTWCVKGAMWPCQDIPEGFTSREEIGALRSALGLGGWKETVAKKELILVVDPKWMTDELADRIEKGLDGILRVKFVWAGRSSLDTVLHSLREAWGILMFSQEFAPWAWVLPRGAYVWEIQNEMEPSASILHMSAAAELHHRLTIVPKGVPNDSERSGLLVKLLEAIRQEFCPVLENPMSVKPKLYMPSGHTGFYAHAGDSFREVAGLWAERGYVDCVPSPVHQVWLGAVGDTLLYDRPTHEWLSRAPIAEQTWRVALFGNPSPIQGGKSWSFWPRRPALVEAAVTKGIPTKPWESRSQSVVFYGRSENAVQKGRRSGDWAAVCSEFIHVDGLKKYPYTAEEYLERLSDARYGLCLAGYGYKCHREIECMAMGCVPIVAAEVDMENYAEPPEEGLHYLRVKGPQDVPGLVGDITAERWTVMSIACRDWWSRNASVEGMWELTKRQMA